MCHSALAEGLIWAPDRMDPQLRVLAGIAVLNRFQEIIGIDLFVVLDEALWVRPRPDGASGVLCLAVQREREVIPTR